MSPPLRATYRHPRTDEWARPGGPWSEESLDDVLDGTSPVEERIAEITGGLVAQGVGPGSTVSWQLPNGWAAIGLFRACWRLGAVAAPIHHLAGAADLAAMRARLDPAVFVAGEDHLPTGAPVRSAPSPVDPASIAVALGTSGSTGTPKVALHTHRALVHKTRTMTAVHDLGPDDAVLMPAPMAHISGLLNGVLLAASGMRVVPMAKWDPGDRARPHRAGARHVHDRSPGVLRVADERAGLRPGGGGLAPPHLVRRRRRHAGVHRVRVRGAGVSHQAQLRLDRGAHGDHLHDGRLPRARRHHRRPTRRDGRAPHRRSHDGRRRRAGAGRRAPGAGPELFVGYDDPAATATAFADGGWFRTGDLATVDDDGWLTIVGRIKDVIIRAGENIATSEIERVLEAHPAVREAVVVGEPDLRLGERVCAFVVLDGTFTLDDCRAWFAEQEVTRFKWPERVEPIDALPLLGSGKPDKAALRARLAQR